MEPTFRTYGHARVEIHPTGESLGQSAASRLRESVHTAVEARGEARLIVATGNSQFPLMTALRDVEIPWDKVTVFHLDEYVGIDPEHTASFHRWIKERVEDAFSPRVVHYLDGRAPDLEAERDRYEGLLREAPIDVVCMGIGENGHLAFNEPGDADFEDPRRVNVIDLQPESLLQQVNEGHFPTVADVPAQALSLSIPALFDSAEQIVCVPEARKAAAVVAALTGPVTEDCPASLLQQRPTAIVYLDLDSASELP